MLEVNLPFFALFYFVFEGNFPRTSPRGGGGVGAGIIFGRAIERRVFCVTGLGGAYFWRGLYIKGLIVGILRYHREEK